MTILMYSRRFHWMVPISTISCWSKGIVLIQSSSHIPLVTIYFVLSRRPILWDRQENGQAMQLQIAIQQQAAPLESRHLQWQQMCCEVWVVVEATSPFQEFPRIVDPPEKPNPTSCSVPDRSIEFVDLQSLKRSSCRSAPTSLATPKHITMLISKKLRLWTNFSKY